MIEKKPQFDNKIITTNPNNVWQKVSYSKKSSLHTKSDIKPKTNPTKTTATSTKTITTKPVVVNSGGQDKKTLSSSGPTTAKQKENSAVNFHLKSCNKTNCTTIVGNSQQQQQQQPRRRRANLQEIRQIKRAHRHLLTSGGKDKQQQQGGAGVTTVPHKTQNCQKNSCASTAAATTTAVAAVEAAAAEQKRKEKIKSLSSRNFEKNAHSGGSSGQTQTTTRTKVQQQQQQQQQQHKKQQQQKGKQQQRKKQAPLNAVVVSTYADSVISSRWCSIEEQLDLLDQLLHYCDEEETCCYDSAPEDEHEYFWNKSIEGYCEHEAYNSDEDLDWSDMSTSAPHSDVEGGATASTTSGAGTTSISSTPPSSLKRRGHQHHPRFAGTRRPPAVPNVQEILNALYRGDPQAALSNLRGEEDAAAISDADTLSTLDDSYSQFDEPEDGGPGPDQNNSKSALNLPLLSDSVTNSSLGSNSPTPTDESSMLDENMVNAQTTSTAAVKKPKPKSERSSDKIKKSSSEKIIAAEKAEKRAEKAAKKLRRDAKAAKRASACLDAVVGEAGLDEGIALADDDDMQSAEWAQLRCTSEAAEIVAEREARRNKGRCADYPGLAFGRSIFSSDTMMKFNIIRNELHNIMKTQLKRVIKAHIVGAYVDQSSW